MLRSHLTARRRAGSRAAAGVAASLVVLLLILGACGGNTPSASPTPAASPTRDPNDPAFQHWPDDVIDATIAIGALDNEIPKAGTDLSTAANTQNMALMLSASEGLSDLCAQALPDAQKMAGWSATQSIGKVIFAALTKIKTASDAMVTALKAGDGPGFTTASQSLATALQQYGTTRELLADPVNQALEQKKHLNQ